MRAPRVEEPGEGLRNAGPANSTPDTTGESHAIGIEHIDGLYGYAVVLTRNRAHAEDLVQETYVRALEAVSRLRKDSNIKGWLFTILRNIWLNELRRYRSSPSLVELDFDSVAADEVGGSTSDSRQILMNKENADSVRSAIEQLPLEFREVILLREFEELSYHEIAELLGCPLGTVMSRLGRARAKLRSLLVSRWEKMRTPQLRHSS
jgi:RNA polymerase sigma-70 factor, ECF subfamily